MIEEETIFRFCDKKQLHQLMTKKEIKTFIKAVSNGDVRTVSELLEMNAQYLTVQNFAPPKKDDGQSALQISLKTGNFEIAKLLIDKGADVNFMETSDINEWTAPVLHDCIRATIFNTFTLQKDANRFDVAFSLLKLMLSQNADPNSTDSYGNNCLHRALMDARQMLDNPSTDFTDDILIHQLKGVFSVLIKAGADISRSSEKRESAEKMYKNFKLDRYELW